MGHEVFGIVSLALILPGPELASIDPSFEIRQPEFGLMSYRPVGISRIDLFS